jgi:hypothetical protein
MTDDLRPNESEREFLTIAYNRFYDLYAEVMSEAFWLRDDYYRYSRISCGFAGYSEIMTYEPIKYVLDEMKLKRPPGEAEIATDLFRFVRNIIFHFPFYDRWSDVWISGRLASWNKTDSSIDRFLRKYAARAALKYRYWESDKKLMTYVQVRFPPEYSPQYRVYLRDILDEREGTMFSYIMMKGILNTQVENGLN